MERDRAPEFIAGAGEAIGKGLSGLIGGIGDKLEANKNQRMETDFLRSKYESLAKMAGQAPDDSFYGKSLGAQRGIVTSLEMALNQQEKDRNFLEGQNRFKEEMGLRKIGLANQGAYQNAQIENMQEDNKRQTALANWQMQPDNQTPMYEQMPDGTMAVGVKGDKSGTRFYNFLPAKAPSPYDPKPLSGARITSYGYANDPTPDSNSLAGIGAFVPPEEQAKIKAGQDSPYRLRDGDIAVSPDIEAQFRKSGIKPGDELIVHGEGGAARRVRWMDRTSPKLSGRVDFYSPQGSPKDDGGAVTGFSLLAPGSMGTQTPAKQERVQTATLKLPDGTEQLVERGPNGWQPVQIQQAPQAAPAPDKPLSALDRMRANVNAAKR